MSNAKLKVAVIGVGALGRHHARLLATLPEVELVAVVDRDPARAADVAAAVGAQPFDSVERLPGDIDAVTIAVPTADHAAVARTFLERGIATLVEKPLARSVPEADAMIQTASASGAVLATGHTERFNPAVLAGLQYVTAPRFVEVHRLSTFPERSLDIDVVFDLMIHDLDLLLATVPSEVVDVEAVGVPVLTPRVDIANVRLKFADGCIANLTASRISRDKVRKVRFFQPQSYVSIDCAAQETEAYRLVPNPHGRPRIEGGKLDVRREEPLRLELEDFVRAARTRTPPAVTGEAGRRALAMATVITERMSMV